MFENYLQNLNWPALIVATLAYFAIGSVWFSGLFGKIWMDELKKHNVVLEKPDSKGMMGMMLGSLIYNLLTTFAISYIVYVTGTATMVAGLKMGALIGVCISFASIGVTYNWQSRSYKLLCIDGGYHIAGVLAATLILATWK